MIGGACKNALLIMPLSQGNFVDYMLFNYFLVGREAMVQFSSR